MQNVQKKREKKREAAYHRMMNFLDLFADARIPVSLPKNVVNQKFLMEFREDPMKEEMCLSLLHIDRWLRVNL